MMMSHDCLATALLRLDPVVGCCLRRLASEQQPNGWRTTTKRIHRKAIGWSAAMEIAIACVDLKSYYCGFCSRTKKRRKRMTTSAACIVLLLLLLLLLIVCLLSFELCHCILCFLINRDCSS